MWLYSCWQTLKETMEDKFKHLEFIQGIINRMGQNSFLIKGWTITLVSALFALSAKDSNLMFVIVAYFPAITFWILDGYFIYQEKLFRKLYDTVRMTETTDFSLNTKELDNGFSDWASAILSKTILLFYGSVMTTILIIMYFIK
jgi:hypothetical protein